MRPSKTLLKQGLLGGLALLLSTFAFSCAQQAGVVSAQAPNQPEAATTKVKPDILGAAAAIEDLYNRRYTDAKNHIHLESVLSGIGASAGFGTQMAIREAYINTGQISEQQAFVRFGTKDGQTYYYGDKLNWFLFEGSKPTYTIWGLVSAGAKSVGAAQLPDIKDIVAYNASTIGTDTFGIPRDPAGHEPHETPLKALQNTWPQVRAILSAHHVPPSQIGWVPAIAAQKVIIQQSKKIDPSLAATIVMESALPMSKMDPDTINKH